MLFPISDDNRDIVKPIFVTYVLLAINVVVFVYQLTNPEFTYGWSVVPREIVTGKDLIGFAEIALPNGQIVQIPQSPGPPIIWLTLLTSMFMHGSFGHLIGNMLYLWIFGDNVENRFGHLPFLAFYLSAGIAGSLAQLLMDPYSVIPNLGASGAIAGVMGAYLVLFPRNRVNAVFFYTIITIPAVFVLGMWIVMQMVSGVGSIVAMDSSTGGVAYMAHIGGFITGVIAALFYRSTLKQEPDSICADSTNMIPGLTDSGRIRDQGRETFELTPATFERPVGFVVGNRDQFPAVLANLVEQVGQVGTAASTELAIERVEAEDLQRGVGFSSLKGRLVFGDCQPGVLPLLGLRLR